MRVPPNSARLRRSTSRGPKESAVDDLSEFGTYPSEGVFTQSHISRIRAQTEV